VALGVAVVLSIDLAIQSARTGFRISAETVSGRATHVVTGDGDSLDERLLRTIRIDLRIPASAPIVEGFATSPAYPGRALRVLGIDPFSEGPFRPFVVGGTSGLDVSAFIATRRGAALPASLAEAAGLGIGDSLSVVAGGERWFLPVTGIIGQGDEVTRAGLSDVVLMDIAGAQEILRSTGRLARIDLRFEDDDAGRAALERVTSALPPGARVETVGARTEVMGGMIAAFDVNLTALSLLALVFGMFLIYNAVTFSVVQRRAILGRLRALGVTRGEVLRLILSEAFWIGLLGAALGSVVGVILANGLVGMISRTINDLYFAVSVRQLTLEPVLFAKAIALGVFCTLLAALPPALEAAGASPRLASLRSEVESRVRRTVPRVAALGAAFCLVGGALLALPTRSLGVSFVALFFIITGLAAMTPAGTLLCIGLLRPLISRLGGTQGTMAARGVTTGLSRTAPAIAALVVAVSVTVGLGVMIGSFRGTLTQWLEGTLRADIYVSLPGPAASRASGTLWPDLVDRFSNHPDVVGASTYRGVDVVRDGDAYRLVALDLDPRGEGAFSFVRGRPEAIMADFQAGLGVIVSEPFAYRRGLEAGDLVFVTTDATDGLPILGIFYDYGSEQGTVMMSRPLYDSRFSDTGVTSLGLFVAPGVRSQEVVDELVALVPEGRAVVARTNDTLRTASLEVFERTFRITAVLRLLAFIVAFVGVLSALAAIQLERAREVGLLRASGMTPGELWRLVITQTGLLGLVSGVLAVPVGLILSVVMIEVVNKRSFGWSLTMQLDPAIVLQAIGLAVVAALLAGVYPAWRMARTSPALALRGE